MSKLEKDLNFWDWEPFMAQPVDPHQPYETSDLKKPLPKETHDWEWEVFFINTLANDSTR